MKELKDKEDFEKKLKENAEFLQKVKESDPPEIEDFNKLQKSDPSLEDLRK